MEQAERPTPVGDLPPAIDHPSHYRADTGHEAIDVIEAWGLGFNLGNALKYICRAGRKGGASAATDLAKAIWYLNRELVRLQKRPR